MNFLSKKTFTLVEILITTGIFTLVFSAIYLLISYSSSRKKSAERSYTLVKNVRKIVSFLRDEIISADYIVFPLKNTTRTFLVYVKEGNVYAVFKRNDRLVVKNLKNHELKSISKTPFKIRFTNFNGNFVNVYLGFDGFELITGFKMRK